MNTGKGKSLFNLLRKEFEVEFFTIDSVPWFYVFLINGGERILTFSEEKMFLEGKILENSFPLLDKKWVEKLPEELKKELRKAVLVQDASSSGASWNIISGEIWDKLKVEPPYVLNVKRVWIKDFFA